MKLLILMLNAVLYSTLVFAHGEDKPGPHGGRIEMAKNVHTEVAADKDGSFHIFLLDGNIANPTIKNSSINAVIKSAGKDVKLNCSVMGGTHYHCKSKDTRPTEGQLILKAKRENVQVEVTYDLALLQPEPQKPADHSHH